jgi:hypothetical protein
MKNVFGSEILGKHQVNDELKKKARLCDDFQKRNEIKRNYIQRYNFIELKSDYNNKISYYYEPSTQLIFEFDNTSNYHMFLKSSNEVTRHLKSINKI